MNIIAKRLRIIYKTGKVIEYTHVVAVMTLGSAVIISGEKGGITVNADTHHCAKLLTMDIDWYVPPSSIQLPEIKK